MFIKNLKIVFKYCQINDTFINIVILVRFKDFIEIDLNLINYFKLNLNF